MNVRELVVKIVADTASFKKSVQGAQSDIKDVEKSEKGVEKAGKDVEQQSRKTGEALKKAASDGENAWNTLKGAVLGYISVATAIGAGAQFLEQTKQVQQFSDQLGMGVEEWQAWAGAAESAGGAAEDFGEKMRDIADWMIDLNVNDSGPLKDFAEQTKTSFKDAAGATVPVEEGFLRIAAAVEGMDRDKATGWLTQMGFNQESINLILKGRKSIEALVSSYKEKAVYDKRDIENSQKMRNAWNEVTRVFQRISATALNMLAPAFDWIQQKGEKLFKYVKENGASVERVLLTLATVIGATLIPKLYSMAKAAWASMGPWGLLMAAIMALGLLIDDFIVWLEGGDSALGKFWDACLEGWLLIKGGAEAVLDAIKAMWGTLVEFFTGIGQGIVSAWESAVSALSNVVTGAADTVKGVLTAAAEFVRGVWEAFFGWIMSKFEWLSGAVSSVAGFVSSGIDKVKGWFGGGDSGEAAAAGGGAMAGASIGAQAGTGTMQQAVSAGNTFGAGDAARGARTVNTTNNKTTNQTITNNVTVNTQATDAQGIARDIGPAMQHNQAAQADVAFGA